MSDRSGRSLNIRLQYCYHTGIDKTLAKNRRNLRQSGSHLFYRTPWQGEPVVNIQRIAGMAKPCQVRQALKAIDKRLEELQ